MSTDTAWNPAYSLRKYQQSWCRNTADAFDNGLGGEEMKRLLGIAGTGAGKTIMASALMWREHKIKGGRSLFLADRDKLVSQAVEKIHACTGIIPGREQSQHRAAHDADIVVGSVQTMQNPARREPHKDKFSLVICDEAHLSLAANWQSVLADFPSAKIFGITATPGRSDKKSLLSFYQGISAKIDLFELINLKALVPITVQTCPIKIDATGAKGGAEDQEDMAEAVEPYWNAIIDAWLEHASDRQTLIFHPSRKASRKFTELLIARGISAKHVDGDTKDSDAILKEYGRGDFQVLNNAVLLTTGYDEPRIGCIINLRVTTSRSLYQQMMGRGTRLYCPRRCSSYCEHDERKHDLLILDFLFQFSHLGIMRPSDLIAESPEQKAAIQAKLEAGEKQLNLQEIDDQVTGEREQAMVKALKAATRHGKKCYDARTLSAIMHIPELIDHESLAHWELQPASEGQIEWLDKHGIDPTTIRDRGHAAAVMDAVVARYKKDLASPRQVAMLTRWKIPDPHKVTFADANKLIQERVRNRE